MPNRSGARRSATEEGTERDGKRRAETVNAPLPQGAVNESNAGALLPIISPKITHLKHRRGRGEAGEKERATWP